MNVITRCPLLRNQGSDLRFDTTRSRRIAIRDMGDVHGRTVRHNAGVPKTLVFVHAHPDDEALLTAGTMAKAARHGHRVVLIVATDGAAGLTSSEFIDDLSRIRAAELAKSAQILGVSETVTLGYLDSGLMNDAPGGFAQQASTDIAKQIAEVVNRVQADYLVGYDPSGGYGHPDHLQVHQAVRLAWPQTTAHLFEATLPREPIAKAVHFAAQLGLTPDDFDPGEFDLAWTPARDITHRVNVRDSIAAKQAAIRAHASQAHADNTVRTLGVLSKLPRPVFGAILGREYYVSIDRTSSGSTSNGTHAMR